MAGLNGSPWIPASCLIFFTRYDHEPLFTAGVWAHRADGEPGCAIITEPARGAASDIHARMPLVLDDNCLQAWLDPELQDPQDVREAVHRLEPEAVTCWRVSTRVNQSANTGADLIEPLPA